MTEHDPLFEMIKISKNVSMDSNTLIGSFKHSSDSVINKAIVDLRQCLIVHTFVHPS